MNEDLGSANQVLEYFLNRFCVLQVLGERLRCKEIWVIGANRYRNPDEDLLTDPEARRAAFKSFLSHHEVFALLFARYVSAKIGTMYDNQRSRESWTVA
jgi:hypothetical protein